MKDLGLNKDIIVKVNGIQIVGDESDGMEIVTTGTYHYKNDVAYIIYEEYFEEDDLPVKNMVKIKDDCIEITKKGAYNVNMIFNYDKENLAYYNTPYGQMLIGITTYGMDINPCDDGVVVELKYKLAMNGEYLSDNSIIMTLKNGGNR